MYILSPHLIHQRLLLVLGSDVVHGVSFSPLCHRTVNFSHLFGLMRGDTGGPSRGNCPPCGVRRGSRGGCHVAVTITNFSRSSLAVSRSRRVLVISNSVASSRVGPACICRNVTRHGFRQGFRLTSCMAMSTTDVRGKLLRVSLIQRMPRTIRTHGVLVGRWRVLSLLVNSGDTICLMWGATLAC